MSKPSLKARLADKRLIAAPGIYDMISARIADGMGFEALYMTGYGTVASHLGLPDAGLASYTDMVSRVTQFCQGTRTPVICDGDTGYGGLLNIRHTVRGYEAAGAAGIQIEDQEAPKKCGHTPMKRVVPLAEAVRRIEVAADARASAEFLVVARTDARAMLGLDEALRRGEAFRKAGADIVFVEAPESEAEFAAIGRAFDCPLLANMVEGGKSPMLTPARLQELGFRMAIYPGSGFTAAAAALQAVYRRIRDTGSSLGAGVPLYPFPEMNKLMGFEDVWAFERRWAEGEKGRAS
ncbi:MAG: isocitrate lyase/PEP mutase family protein [Alphaproteobacteria bacterium]|nr:isocitrate lyase/PEP mutase family protein [Alphaproteobacteria bacterium]